MGCQTSRPDAVAVEEYRNRPWLSGDNAQSLLESSASLATDPKYQLNLKKRSSSSVLEYCGESLEINEEKPKAQKPQSSAITLCGPHCKPCRMVSSGLCCIHADQWVLPTETKKGGMRIHLCSHCRTRTRKVSPMSSAELEKEEQQAQCKPCLRVSASA